MKSFQSIVCTLYPKDAKLWIVKAEILTGMTLSKVFQKSILILGTQGHWNMRCCRGLTDRRMSGTVQENVRDAKAGDSTVPRLRFSCWNLYKSGECLEGLIHTVTLGLLNGEQIVATLTNNKISNMWLDRCQWLQMV